jgi:archaellum component FlaG (FlaF/FlaG flagellin family)
MQYTPFRNEFVDQLVNRIGKEYIHFQAWLNPLRDFKRETLFFGDTIEEVNVGLTRAEEYDAERPALEEAIFGRRVPDVRTAFHRINSTRYYPISIQEPMLRRAFTQEYGLDQLVSSLMQSPITSDQRDEFLQMTNLFKSWYRMGGFFRVKVPDVGVSTSTEADAKAMLRIMREFASNLLYPETDFNPARMPVAIDPDDIVIFMTTAAKAAIDVEALAAAYNIDKAEIQNRIVTLPAKYMPIQGVQAILTSKEWFQVYDTLFENTTAENPIGLHQNYFLHHHQIFSASPFVPAVLFWTGDGDTITVEETPVESVTLSVTDMDGATVTQLAPGEVYRVVATAVTNPAGGVNSAVRLELEPGSTTALTYVRQTGTLVIGLDEHASTITVNGYAEDTDFPQIVESVTLPVIGEGANYWPNPSVSDDGDRVKVAAPGGTFPAIAEVTASNATNAGKLAGLGFVADPATAWTAGQKFTIGTYDFNWSGTAWAAGAHA